MWLFWPKVVEHARGILEFKLKDWCELNGLCWVNGFYSEKWRGTWRSNFNGLWYELDGFVMKERERHKYVRKVKTVGENVISDHKPKKLAEDGGKGGGRA